MESFFRYVAYVDYYKEGIKIRNVGFLKWRLFQDEHTIVIGLKGLPEYKRICSVREIGSGKELGRLHMEQGIACFEKSFPDRIASKEHYIDLEAGRLYLRDVQGFVIELDSKEYLRVEIRVQEDKCFENKIKDIDKVEEVGESSSPKKEEMFCMEPMVNTEEEIKQQKEIKKEENIVLHGIQEKYEIPVVNKEIQIMKPIPENKWDLLCQQYPKMHPFANGREFLMLKPKDFVVLRQEYQKLAHNSFLLHGYYNYGHMILGKLSEEENGQLYIGVPGVYYDREKQAAQMFGFVGFEAATKPVQQGSYGYYMMEVEI